MMTLGAMALPGTEGVALTPNLRCGCLKPSGMNPRRPPTRSRLPSRRRSPRTSGLGNWRRNRTTPGACAHGASGGNRTGPCDHTSPLSGSSLLRGPWEGPDSQTRASSVDSCQVSIPSPRGNPRVFDGMRLRHPDIQELRRNCEQGAQILISAPFYSQEGLTWVRPNPGGHVEFWTRFNPRDWAAGVSDPPALLHYLENVGEDRVSLRVHRALHAKIYQVDTTWSWIGSPNLSRAAFTSNIELVAELDAEETESLGNFVNDLRVSLRDLTVPDLRAYIETCKDTMPLDDHRRQRSHPRCIYRPSAPSLVSSTECMATYRGPFAIIITTSADSIGRDT